MQFPIRWHECNLRTHTKTEHRIDEEGNERIVSQSILSKEVLDLCLRIVSRYYHNPPIVVRGFLLS